MRKARVTFSLQFASQTSSTAVEMSVRQLLLQKCWLGWEPMNFDQFSQRPFRQYHVVALPIHHSAAVRGLQTKVTMKLTKSCLLGHQDCA